jgi:uncharacterized small protein (DUF1192 family)
MEKPGLMNSVSEPGCVRGDADYLETIALLQDEISRLEAELLTQDDSGRSSGGIDLSVMASGDSDGLLDHQEVQRLRAELTARDETIKLLFDQLRLVEDAEAASRAEWEQLSQWVAEVEQRVERQDDAGTATLAQELDSQRRQADETRLRLERERKAWNKQRGGLEQEIQRLETLLARGAQEVAAPKDAAALEFLETENQRLRQLCNQLEETGTSDAQSLHEAIDLARRELEEVRKERDLVKDERDRERREYEIAVASLRSHASRAALAAHESENHATSLQTRSDVPSGLEADIRIHEFRQHLKEIHSHEAEARNRKRLGGRLSRLWTRTGPR